MTNKNASNHPGSLVGLIIGIILSLLGLVFAPIFLIIGIVLIVWNRGAFAGKKNDPPLF